jgi:hypothetical protein
MTSSEKAMSVELPAAIPDKAISYVRSPVSSIPVECGCEALM